MKRKKNYAKILRSRELRKESTEAEKVLWKYLRNRNFYNKKFRRQYIFLGFIIDFYCPEEKLGIELDGSVHLNQKEYDTRRQNIIEEKGIRLLRFKNSDVLQVIEDVLQTIKSSLSAAKHPFENPSPSKMEKGAS